MNRNERHKSPHKGLVLLVQQQALTKGLVMQHTLVIFYRIRLVRKLDQFVQHENRFRDGPRVRRVCEKPYQRLRKCYNGFSMWI